MLYNRVDKEAAHMKEWGLIVWIPQFAISIASPLVIFLFGLITAVIGFRDTARAMLAASGHSKKSRDPGVSFNHHE